MTANNAGMSAGDKMRAARSQLILREPFFGALALRLKLIECHEVRDCDPATGEEKVVPIPTAATDGEHLFYNPEFVAGLTLAQAMGLTAHEVLHCVNGHGWRMEWREHQKWNAACDFAINPIVRASGLDLPPDGLEEANATGVLQALAKGWVGKPAEQIYAELPPDWKQQHKGNGGGGWNWGDVLPGKPGEAAEKTAEWRTAAISAARAAKQQGKLPADLERLIGEVSRPKLDWRGLLWQFVQSSAARDDYNWQRPSARWAQAGFIMPSLRSERVPPIFVAVDTSGSVSEADLNSFASELTGIMAQLRPERLYVAYIDAAVAAVDEFEPGDEIKLTPRGGGGTDFRPAFKYVAEQDITPCCLIYFTDLWGTFPGDAPEYPVLWIATTDEKAPFGETVRLEVGHG